MIEYCNHVEMLLHFCIASSRPEGFHICVFTDEFSCIRTTAYCELVALTHVLAQQGCQQAVHEIDFNASSVYQQVMCVCFVCMVVFLCLCFFNTK